MTNRDDQAPARTLVQRHVGLALLVLMLAEKALAHSYTVITIYALPAPWKYWVPGLIGLFGVWLVVRGLGRDEVKGSLMGYGGAVLIWMSWFESGLPLLAAYEEIPRFLPEEGNRMAGLLGEHVILQTSGLFCFVILFFLLLNKDVRCRMLIWLRRRLGLQTRVGKPTPRYQPNVARVAALEYLFVTWFMYAITLVLIDPRLLGLYHPVTYALSALIAGWGIYCVWQLLKPREAGLAVRYAIGAVGVFWFIPEILALYEVFSEFYIYIDRHWLVMTGVIVLFVVLFRKLWTIPVDSRTGRAA